MPASSEGNSTLQGLRLKFFSLGETTLTVACRPHNLTLMLADEVDCKQELGNCWLD